MIANATMASSGAPLQFVCTIPELRSAVYLAPLLGGGGWAIYYQNDASRSLPSIGCVGVGGFSFLAGFINPAEEGGYVARELDSAHPAIHSDDVPSAARRVVERYEQAISEDGR